MKILSAKQIREWDQRTVANLKISSLKLMENAAEKCTEWLLQSFKSGQFLIFCGPGNNGGDGFAIARLLYGKGFDVDVFIDKTNVEFSQDAAVNYKKLQDISGISVYDFTDFDPKAINSETVLIDALFGTGLSRPITGRVKEIIEVLNRCKITKVSVDLPSGLFADQNIEPENIVFKADHTLTFQNVKRSFGHPETGKFCGNIIILDIGLDADFPDLMQSDFFATDAGIIKSIYKPREQFSHKGSYGKSCIVAGSYGKIGAAVLATQAALRTGSGLTFILSPKCGYQILQSQCPEAMFIEAGENLIEKMDLEEYFTVGIGPGMGKEQKSAEAFINFLELWKKPVLIDADALNILAGNNEFIKMIPENSILTPHPKEFERLFGKTLDSFERLQLAQEKAAELKIIIVLKDHHTQVVLPNKKVYYNYTGNPGMAKGGSGDVLTGIITSLLAQGYNPNEAAVFGVWLHGAAGDLAAEKFSEEAMLPSDLILGIGSVFMQLKAQFISYNGK